MAADLIDISQPLRSDMPYWPGDTPFETEPVWQIGPDCPVSVSRFGCSTHAGTHADAPSHYDADGAAIDALDLDPFLGPATLIDARAFGPVVTPEQLGPALPASVRRVLLRTWDRFPHAAWRDDFITLHPEAVSLLAERGARLVGVDAPSIDPRTAKRLHAHDAARAAGLRILEGLVLDHVAPGEYELIALPLRLAGLDASPVRAVLRRLAA
ncbi:arylformamidase [Acetobacteraceae bacterium KSS8]|uniref:Kynurenine formamidase n=1 Tax=Endosaccharibacter trunci TaxID=2812733 RepID=A0ABT1W792_9PROT|nr:arylformamidase [Acetobacteraceae bacterium KSS8]